MIKKFFSSTLGIIITLVVAIVAGIFIGKSQWLHDLFATKALPDGTACTTPDNKAGTIISGVCQAKVGPGGPGGGNPSARLSNPPSTLVVPSAGVACQPVYSYMGVDYTFLNRRGNMCYYKRA